MNSFNQTHMENIKSSFEKKTGVNLSTQRPMRKAVRAMAIVAAAIIGCFSMTAFAVREFSSLSGDDLALSSSYKGNGVVWIYVENKSGKELSFEPTLKLMNWATGKEIEAVSDKILFANTDIPAGSSSTMIINLKDAYDMESLEKPLQGNDGYYFTLTNNSFLFGQDWMCTVEFSENIQVEKETAPLSVQVEAKEEPVSSQLDGTIVYPVETMALTMEDSDEKVIFDSTVPEDMQLQLTGLHRRVTDGFNKKIGGSAMVLSAYIPQHKGEIDGGVDIPLIYVFIYEVSAIQSMQDCAFISDQILTFEEMEEYKIYKDEQYVCYDMSDLFYSDLREYVESIVDQRSDAYFDEQIWERVQNIYTYYKENMGSLIVRRF